MPLWVPDGLGGWVKGTGKKDAFHRLEPGSELILRASDDGLRISREGILGPADASAGLPKDLRALVGKKVTTSRIPWGITWLIQATLLAHKSGEHLESYDPRCLIEEDGHTRPKAWARKDGWMKRGNDREPAVVEVDGNHVRWPYGW